MPWYDTKAAGDDILFSDWNDLVAAVGASGTGNIVNTVKYIIYKSGSDHCARNGDTGVVDYGGSGDAGGVDGADAAAVIQAVVDAINSAGGGTAVAKSALYEVSSRINMKTNATLVLMSGVTIKYTGAALANYGVIDFNNIQNAHLIGLDSTSAIIDADSLIYHNIRSYGSSLCTVANLELKNADHSSLMLRDSTSDLDFRNLYIHSYALDQAARGIQLYGCSNSRFQNILIDGANCGATAKDGISVGGGAEAGAGNSFSNVLTNVIVKNARENGVYIHGGVYSGYNRFINLVCDTCGLGGNYSGAKIIDSRWNVMEVTALDCKVGVELGNEGANRVCAYNKLKAIVKGSTSYGFSVDQTASDGTIIYNQAEVTVYDSATDGVKIVSSDSGEISYNQFHLIVDSAAGDGIQFTAADAAGYIRHNQFHAIVTNSSEAGAEDYGIHVRATGTPANVQYNHFVAHLVDNDAGAVSGFVAGSNNVFRGAGLENSGTSTGTGAQQTIAHGMVITPTRVQLSDLENGAAPYQSAVADATNIYVTAGNGLDYLWKVWLA